MSIGKARILVVDDDACLRDLLKLHLAGAGYEVALAADAIEAGYAILKSAPDLLIVDVNMPYMSGIELVSTLIADGTVPSFPFMFLSSDETRMERGYGLGATAYLLKPVVKDRLLDAVDRALRRSRRDTPEVRVAVIPANDQPEYQQAL